MIKHSSRLVLFILIVLSFMACQKLKVAPSENGRVEGKLVLINNDTPVEGIELLLIDKNAVIDSISFDNKAAFLDTVTTNADGNYSFDKLKEGRYAIVPLSSGYNYYDHSNGIEFENNGEDTYVLNFSCSINVQSPWSFISHLKIINLPEDFVDDMHYILQWRKRWVLFVPFWAGFSPHEITKLSSTSIKVKFTNVYGSFLFYVSTENTFKLKIATINAELLSDKEIVLSTPLSSTPEYVYWQYDWATDQLERVDPF